MSLSQLFLRNHAALAGTCFLGGIGYGFWYTMEYGRPPLGDFWAWARGAPAADSDKLLARMQGPARPAGVAVALEPVGCNDGCRSTAPRAESGAQPPYPGISAILLRVPDNGCLVPAAGQSADEEQPLRAVTLRLR